MGVARRKSHPDSDFSGSSQPLSSRPLSERLWSALIGLLVFITILVAALPIFAIVRGTSAGIALARAGNASLLNWLGLELALVALGMGAFFFAYSLKYYLATATMLLLAFFGPGRSGSGPHRPGHLGRLTRIARRGWIAQQYSTGNRTKWLPLGYEPFVSIHIATYNEKGVVGRLLEACARLNYTNYEVILVDDSTDGSMEVLEPWRKVDRFTIIHRDTRDGFKGGALTYALRAMDPRTEFVAIFDADAVPFPDVLRDLLYHFYSSGNPRPRPIPEVGAVQSYQWHVLNKSESWLTAAVRTEYAGSYMVERPFQQILGSMKMIAGTAYMIRAGLLRELGWGRSLTEDWELTLRLYAKGYKVVYTPYAETPAECVATFGRLARQRMRWAEGHSYNVNKWFLTILRSPRLSLLEKAEFIYYGLYYLQSALFMLGSAAWLVSEIVLRVHIPEWTAMLGWSLLFSNLFALPLMNLGGLLLEGSPRRDYQGVLGAVALSFLLVPFQAWASVKGLFERKEGGWFRTPKTGRITDRVEHLPQQKRLKRWLRPRPSKQSGEARFMGGRRAGRSFRLVCIAAPVLLLTILGIGAATAPTVLAANVYYLHHPAGAYAIDNSAPSGSPTKFQMNTPGATQTWASSATVAAQTIPAGSYIFSYWTSDSGGATVTVLLTFGYSATASCAVIVPIASWTASLDAGESSTSASRPAVILPANSYLCWRITVVAVSQGGLDLYYDGKNQPTSIATPSIVVPEHGSPLIGLAILLPLVAAQLIRRPLWAKRRVR
ncbi:MAG: glycosyltransferase [Candidatus Dormibacteraeota bacterium]|nr:glycosyltransferase [Candidatus Dormibacteraeota bacterium]